MLELKTQYDIDLDFIVSLRLNTPSREMNPNIIKQLNDLLTSIDDDLKFEV